jgi:hypothetical protein
VPPLVVPRLQVFEVLPGAQDTNSNAMLLPGAQDANSNAMLLSGAQDANSNAM